MKTIETVVYDFIELNDKAKEKAIKKWYESEDYPFFTDDLKEELKRLDVVGLFSNIKLCYSLSWSKGDGLSFSGDIDLCKWLTRRNMKKSVYDAVYNNIETFGLKANSGRYAYASKDNITWSICNGVGKRLEKKIDDIMEEVQDYYMDICRKLERHGYSILEYRMNNEEFNELCLANDYTFLPDGTMKNN